MRTFVPSPLKMPFLWARGRPAETVNVRVLDDDVALHRGAVAGVEQVHADQRVVGLKDPGRRVVVGSLTDSRSRWLCR